MYNTHRGISYVKSNVAPATQYSDLQVSTRALMVPIIAAWQSLTDEQRLAWQHFANLHLLPSWTGSPKRLSGWAWFAKANFKTWQTCSIINLDPPFPVTEISYPNFYSASIPSYLELAWDIPDPSPNPMWHLVFWICGPHSTGSQPSIKMAKRWGSQIITAGEDVLGPFGVGQYTLFIVPLSEQGITMPFIRWRFQITS